MTIRLPPDVESRLRNEASRRGLDASDYASEIIAEHLPIIEDAKDDGPEERPPRGFVPMHISHECLFDKPLEFRVEDLPRWQPEIVIYRRVLEELDEAGDA